MKVTITWNHLNPKPGFVSAWDATRNHVGHAKFDGLDREAQIQSVRDFCNRKFFGGAK